MPPPVPTMEKNLKFGDLTPFPAKQTINFALAVR
jgi:hypothetical protein